jgi:hypothetical protein
MYTYIKKNTKNLKKTKNQKNVQSEGIERNRNFTIEREWIEKIELAERVKVVIST